MSGPTVVQQDGNDDAAMSGGGGASANKRGALSAVAAKTGVAVSAMNTTKPISFIEISSQRLPHHHYHQRSEAEAQINSNHDAYLPERGSTLRPGFFDYRTFKLLVWRKKYVTEN